jgi:four helix bundle protein
MVTIERFEDLEVWQEAQLLAVEVYHVTRSFPKDEIYAMTSQLRRAASSISANIAEGFGRSTVKDKIHFYTIAYGSLLEVKNFLYLAQKLDYIDEEILNNLIEHSIICQKLINGSKRWLLK